MTPNEEFAPHPAIDLTSQDAVFLALEELGIAHMQHAWMAKNAPEHEDAEAVAEQAGEFFEDLSGLFSGEAGPDRVIPNGWAGMRMGEHLRRSIPSLLKQAAADAGETKPVEQLSDAAVIRLALGLYLASLEKVSALDAAFSAKGQKLPPKLYIDFMAAWSGLFCGKNDVLQLDERFAL